MEKILKNFKINGTLLSCERYGEGHINDTYLAEFDTGKYILQRINNYIFEDVEGLMNNIYLVTSFLKEKLTKKEKDVSREILTLVETKEGKPYYYDTSENKYYRVYIFVTNSITLQKVTNPEDFKQSAIAFGKFQNLLKDFDSTKLVEVLKNFHNTKIRFEHFLETLKKDEFDRAKNCQKEIDFILKRKADCEVIVNLIKDKKIPLKVTHNDTKLNNVLLDANTKKALCVIDLDTIMPGSALYDFGDSIRFGCNMASEDEKDLSKVIFSIDYFKAYAEGYLSEVKDSLNQYELDNLAFASKLMTLECGMRFLDDYLDGDKYFKIHREGHNLDRCRTQLTLVEQIEDHLDELNAIIKEVQ